MPKCKHCQTHFDGPYRQKFCSLRCQFLSKVPAGLGESECWEWSAARLQSGYGVIMVAGDGLKSAHRVSYELFVSKIPEGMFVCHHCDNPCCVNPSHLFIGTNADNAADMAKKGRAAWKNKSQPPEIREKISATRRMSGWKPSQAQIQASIVARAEKMKDPDYRESVASKMRGEKNPNYGKTMSQETRDKLASHWEKGGPMLGKKHSEATKQKMREAALARQKQSIAP